MQEDIDLSESFEGEEGAVVNFPLSGTWWASVFILLFEELILVCIMD
jgi:hypothetical protein